MYGLLWRQLPGPWPAKAVGMLVLLATSLFVLFYLIFPAVDPHLPFNNVTVEQQGPAGGGAPTTPAATPSGSP